MSSRSGIFTAFIELMEWLIKPHIKIRLKDAIGTDGVARPCHFYCGVLYEFQPCIGYWQEWYDGPIHHWSWIFVQWYWHVGVQT